MTLEAGTEPTGYDMLVGTDPDDAAWVDAMKAAVADGSALDMASTTEDVRRRIAGLRGNS